MNKPKLVIRMGIVFISNDDLGFKHFYCLKPTKTNDNTLES